MLWSCAGPGEVEPYVDHGTPLDLVELTTKSGVTGIPDAFDRHHVLDDGFFTAVDAVSAEGVQRFLERSPYGRRCFLADVRVGGGTAAEAIVKSARAEGINPIVMLARMQVEKSLIAKTSSPGGAAVDYAFGCGCPDNRACNPAYRGLDKQIACAARTLRRHFDGSVDGSGAWRKGRTRDTLDPLSVTPANHATASLYAYTPWVLQGRGGNWLVWNITLRFADHFSQLGVVDLPGDDPGAEPGPAPAWVGTPCDDDAACDFGAQGSGSCQRYEGGGICTLSCEGFCPDRAGDAPTFCVAAKSFGEQEDFGLCTVEPTRENRGCADIPGMVVRRADRYLGRSGASRLSLEVCLPPEVAGEPPAAAPPPAEPPPTEPPPRDDPPVADPPTGVWVGDPCVNDAGCGFIANGRRGHCFRDHRPANGVGFCTFDCDGLCPDRDGRAATFCAPVRALGGAGGGACVEQSDPRNDHCADRDAMRELEVPRYIGSSGADPRHAIVCAPDLPVGRDAPQPAGNGGVCEVPEAPLSDNGDSCAGVQAETWRCACSARFETTVSQVCRSGRWLNYQLDPRDCGRCNGRYSNACED